MASRTYSRKKTNWKKPKTISERWEDWFPSPDPDDARPTNRRGRKTGPSKNERLDIEQDKSESQLAASIEQRTKDLNLGYSSRAALQEAYERGEVTDSDISGGGVTGFYDEPTQIDLGTETVPNEGGDEEDDTSSGVIEQPPTGDDQEQANTENRGELKKDIDRQIAVAKNEEYLKSVSWDGMNRTYTSNYREAVKNAAGWSAYYDDSPDPNNPIARSDVFTRGEDGQPLGVMTRSQRRAYDERMHEAKMNQQHQKNADEATGGSGVYGEKGKETTTEWTTDQEANEAGKVITGGESAKTNVAEKSQANIIEPPERKKIELPGGK